MPELILQDQGGLEVTIGISLLKFEAFLAFEIFSNVYCYCLVPVIKRGRFQKYL